MLTEGYAPAHFVHHAHFAGSRTCNNLTPKALLTLGVQTICWKPLKRKTQKRRVFPL